MDATVVCAARKQFYADAQFYKLESIWRHEGERIPDEELTPAVRRAIARTEAEDAEHLARCRKTGPNFGRITMTPYPGGCLDDGLELADQLRRLYAVTDENQRERAEDAWQELQQMFAEPIEGVDA